jgi:hypothetical protein
MLRMMSMTPAELLHRRAVQEALRSTAEADAAIRAARCGTKADLEGFAAAALAELMQGSPR